MYPAHSQSILVNKPPSSYQNYVQQAIQSPHWKQAEFNGFHLVGQGQSKPYCKKWISYGCDNIKQHPRKQHYAEHTLKTCKVSNCPLCFESWIGRQANRSTKRLSKFLEKRRFNFRHVMLSPPQHKALNLSEASLNKWLRTVMKIGNIKTAMLVFHPFRFQDKKKSMPYDSPHFHLLVYGHLTNTIEVYNKTKWTIKNLGDLKTDKDIFTCTRYLLSHTGVKKGRSAVRYFGDISYRKLKVEKESKIPHCPYCSLPLRIFSINFDVKHKPPPIDYVGLWNPSCFTPVEDKGNDTKIPFYEMNEDKIFTTRDLKEITKDDKSYSEELIYSFEELMHIQLNSNKICEHKYFYNQLKFKTALSCELITSFC